MANTGPLSIEAPKPDSHIVNENEHAVVPRPIPGPMIPGKEPNDTISQQPTTTSWSEEGRQKIPPGFQRPPAGQNAASPPPYPSGTIAAAEQQAQHRSIETKAEFQQFSPNAAVAKFTTCHTETRSHQRAHLVEDGQGNLNVYRKIMIEQRTVQVTEISQVLCTEVNSFFRNARAVTDGQGDHEAKANCGEKTIDCCCQSLSCDFSQNPFKKNAHTVTKNKVMNATKRRARAKGYTILKGLIYPFVSDITRDFWVFFQLIFFLMLLSLSASVFVLAGRNYEGFHAAHLGFSVLAAFLATLDWIVCFTQCSTCRACISCCREKAGRKKSKDIMTSPATVSADKSAIDDAATTSNNNIDEAATTGNEKDDYVSASTGDKNKCRKCFEASRSRLDLARVFLTEFLLVPIIFCDMFEVATGKGFNSDVLYHRIGFALMVYDSIGLIVFVFLLRLVILGRTIHSEQKMHLTEEDIQKIHAASKDAKSVVKDYGVDGSIKKNSLQIQIVFFLHVFGQTIAHALMLVAVGAKIAYDTRDYGTTSTQYRYVAGFGYTRVTIDNTYVATSSYLWYMLVAAYILPSFGICTFFVVNNYWVQQYLIGLCIDFVKLLRVCEDTNVIKWEGEKPSEAICKFVRMHDLPGEYEKMRDNHFCEKLGYPFLSPGFVIVCIIYATCHFAFVLCSIYTIDNMAEVTVVFLNGGGWYIYVVVAAVVGAIINVYSFLVAGLWIMIIGMAIAFIVLLIAGCIFCVCFCGISDSNNN